MTSTPVTNLTTASEARPLITPRGWVWIGLLSLLFVALHRNFLYRSLLIALDDNNWSHAMLIPFISLYYLYQNRARLMDIRSRVCWWGLPLVFAGMASYAFWIFPGRNDMFQGYSMILGLFGLVLFLVGPRMMAVAWFPILYLGFGVKVAQKLWEIIALKLQTIAAASSTIMLNIIGLVIDIEASVRGNTIDLIHRGVPVNPPLNVAEACSGLRMLMAFLALGVAMAFLAPRRWWQRGVMVLMTLPIAVAVNVGRVTTLGVLHIYAPEYAKGEFHIFIGMLMLIPAAGMFLLLGWVLDKIIIEDEAPRGGGDTHPRQPLAPFEPTENDPSLLVKGALMGAALTAMVSACYLLVIMLIRPDFSVLWIGGTESRNFVIAAVALVALVLILVVALACLIPRHRRLLPGSHRAFVLAICCGLFTTALVAQEVVLSVNGVVVFKEELPVRKTLELIEHPTGTWRFVRQDPPLAKDIIDELGTEMYLNRTYEDTAWTGGLRGRIAEVHIAYYTGTPDTVPHVPQQCFKAGGLVQVDGGGTVLNLQGDSYRQDPKVPGGYLHPMEDPRFGPDVRIPGLEIPATYFTFANPANRQEVVNVAYFFVANGKFLPRPRDVRLKGFDLRDKYSYYCKIQVTVGVEDKEVANERIASLLSELMPQIMLCLPDWVDVTEGRWPAEVTAGAISPTGAGE